MEEKKISDFLLYFSGKALLFVWHILCTHFMQKKVKSDFNLGILWLGLEGKTFQKEEYISTKTIRNF